MNNSLTKKQIAKKLKMLREKNGYTQKDIGEMTNKAHTTIASWESAKSQPDVDTLFSLCVLYGVDDVLSEFDYKESEKEISHTEQELIGIYRHLSPHAQKLASDLIYGVYELEKSQPQNTVAESPILAVARGDGQAKEIELRPRFSLRDLLEDPWQGQ